MVRRPINNGDPRAYDELAMPIKVRNRTWSDANQNPVEPVPRRRPEAQIDVPGDTVHPAAYAGLGYAAAGIEGAPKSEADDDWRGGTWADSGYSATDAEAHRDITYEPPNFIVQTLIVMFAQMKSYSKGKATFILIAMIALIPILVFAIPDYIDSLAIALGATVSNAYTGLLLAFLPLIVALFTAKQCGTQVPNEFKDRTAFMSIPLPMHRLSFFFGKYLAGFLYCTALFLLAFGVAVLCTSMKFDNFYSDVLLEAFAGTVVAILVYSSTAFCIGCFVNRGSVLLPILLNLVGFPLLFIMVGVRYELSAAFMMPVFLPDVVIQSLGFPLSGSLAGASYASVMMGGMGFELGSMWAMCAIGLVWAAGFLALGAFRMTRREA